LAQCLQPARVHPVSVGDDLVPHVAAEAIHVAPLTGPAFADCHVDLLQVADPAGDGRRAGLQLRREFGRRAAVIGAKQRREDPGGHAWHAGADQVVPEPLNEVDDRGGVAPLSSHVSQINLV
jgi:hypothetical protein